MSRYKAYPEYKDSGVEWLGEIPRDWKTSPLKFLARIKNGQDYKDVEAEDGYPVIGSGGQFSYATTYSYDKESVLLGRKGTIDKPLYVNEPFWTVDTMYYTEINRGVPPKFLYYLALTIQFSRYSTNTALPSMTQENLGNYFFAIPEREQAKLKIAAFLDHETAKIDALIEKQQRLIELLKEKRQAVISHAVTKGLNPNAEMKDSGVEWLGEVPAHWNTSKLLNLTSRIGDGLHAAPEYQDGTGIYFINGNNLVDGQIFIGTTAKEVPVFEYEKNYIFLNSSSVLLSINGTVGNVALFNGEKIVLGKSSAYINCFEALRAEYLMIFLQSDNSRRYFEQEVTGTTIFNLSLNSIRKIRVSIPSISEQNEIVCFCKRQKEKYAKLVQKAECAIELMRERRTALISAAVTGKIDVRDWQPAAAQEAVDIGC
jgi:type I restriction enzyme, S subunit